MRSEIATLSAKVLAAQNNVQKRYVRAPVSGVVAKSSVHTVGGVVRSGDVIAEIVPSEASRIVEALVSPQDIDYVRAGQEAEVIVTAFNRRLYDPVKASVEFVAADSIPDEKSGERFFSVRLKLLEPPTENNRLANLRPGMQSEVYVTTSRQNFLSYALKPISDSFRRAFREQ